MKRFFGLFLFAAVSFIANAQDSNVIDEIVWVVGDDAILRSDVEMQRLLMSEEGKRFNGDPYCVIPEQIALQKLFLHQAKLDSIEIPEAQVVMYADQSIAERIKRAGSKEQLEEYLNKPLPQIREETMEMIREQQTVQNMRSKITGDIKLTPSEVRRYYNELPKDSLPYIPMTVEVQIITMEPKISIQEVDAVKARLRDFTERVNSGEQEFSTLARMYSQDRSSAIYGGEIGFSGKGMLAPEYANAAFNLNDNKKVSKIVETEFGYHIIQLIEKRGDRINTRHILLNPEPSDKEIEDAVVKMDSLYNDMLSDKFSFEDAALFVSYDKDTKNNKGIMVNSKAENERNGTPKFEMSELPIEVARAIDALEPGQFSKPFKMKNEKNNKDVIAIAKLKTRTPGHRANMADDYQVLMRIVEQKKQEDILSKWIANKQKETYIRINPSWVKCDFMYPGWIKE